MKKRIPGQLTPEQLAELKSLAVLPDHGIDTSDEPELLDWSGAKRGLFQISRLAEALQIWISDSTVILITPANPFIVVLSLWS